MNPVLLEGLKVVGTEGYILGEISDIEINPRNWQADAFCVNLSSDATAELGFKKPFLRKITVCLPTRLIGSIGDVITLKEPVRNLKDIEDRHVSVNYAKLRGKKVVGLNGRTVGEVEGFDLNLDKWQVTGLQVGLTDDAATEMGFKRPFLSKVVVVIPSKVVDEVGNFINLNKTIENLESLVECIHSCKKV